MELPSTFSAWVTASSEPTMVTRSPICNCNCGEATKSTPERLTRVMFAPKLFLILSCESVFPFNSGLVIRIRREMSSLFSCSHSILISFPKNTVIASTSIGVEITNMISPTCRIVSELTNSVSPPSRCLMREMTNLRFSNGRSSLILMPSTDSFLTSMEIGRTVSSWRCPRPTSASFSS